MINLMPNEDQQEMVRWAEELLAKELPTSQLLQNDITTPLTANVLRTLAELGFLAFTLDGPHGGGMTHADEALMFRELGRSLVPGPVVGTTLAARIADSEGDAELAAAFASGRALADLAEVGEDGRVSWLESAVADYLLVVNSRDVSLSLIARDDLVEFDCADSIDPYFRMVTLVASELPAPILASGNDRAEMLAHGRLLTSAYLAGIAEFARDDSATYAKERVQFGKPIGVFQAVKHRCADNAVRAEAAWAQTAVAAVRLGDVSAAGAELDVAAAKVISGDSAIRNARDNIQNHGGMGYTAENAAHLYLKRAHLLANVFGDPRSFTELMLEGSSTW